MNRIFVFSPFLSILTFLSLLSASGTAQTIAEKKAGVVHEHQDMSADLHKTLQEVNRALKLSQGKLRSLYAQVHELHQQNAPAESYAHLLEKIKEVRNHILTIEEEWREVTVQAGSYEAYALWHQPETTIDQLVMDYGSQDFVYLVPAEVGSIKVSIDSNIPIPRASWEEMLDLILVQNGVGYNQLNPYLRQLFMLKDNKSGLKVITNQRREIDLFPSGTRICFVLTPEPAEVRRTWLFLDKFVNPNSTMLQMVGRDILIVGPVGDVQDLLKLYDFVATNKGEKEYKIFPVRRIDAEEMAKILAAIFDQTHVEETANKPFFENKENRQGPRFRQPPPPPQARLEGGGDANGLKVITLAHVAKALFLVGTKEEIRKAEQIIHQIENQVGEAREKIIYWYTAKNSDPEELADVLQKIYSLMIKTGVATQQRKEGPIELAPIPSSEQVAQDVINKEIDLLPSELYQTSYYQQGNYVVNPAPVEPRRTKTPTYNTNRENFIVDPKTGSIAMVIEADILPKIKELIKKLDVAKRMVQIEALLFERRLNSQNQFGLNLLQVGDCAKGVNSSCLEFNNPKKATGLLDYILSRAESSVLPAYDLIYRFLMTQDDIQINASPSIVAVNQTEATIAIVEEISINTGIYNVETAKGNTLEKAFTRAQYGITIDITPTIHITDEEGRGDESNYVTLETDITFDTVQGGNPERPDVTRRHITNEVRIPDGQTIILGGLRRKITDDNKDSIPFFGELPCIGKFFSMRKLSDIETEMFIFLTPTIISDPLDDFERIKCEEMRRRPGDIPEFLCSLVRAREIEKNRVLVQSMVILLGPKPDRCHSPAYLRPSNCGTASWIEQFNYLPPCGEYDGQ